MKMVLPSYPLLFLAFVLWVQAGSDPVERQSDDVTISSSLFEHFKFFAQYAGAAYCNSNNAEGQVIACGLGICDTATRNNATTFATFAGNATNQLGYIAIDPVAKLIVVSFRGSYSIQNWIANFLFWTIPCELVNGCQVHFGFWSAWIEVSDAVFVNVAKAVALHPDYAVVATGHSLGGAIATIAGAYMRRAGYRVDIFTYGSPRVGNEAFASFVTAQTDGGTYRTTHFDDPVPRLPAILVGYRHTSPEYWLYGGPKDSAAAEANRSDYTINDLHFCTGTANISCNAGTTGLDVTAHEYYLQRISGCDQAALASRQGEGALVNAERVKSFAVLDVQFVRDQCAWSGSGLGCYND